MASLELDLKTRGFESAKQAVASLEERVSRLVKTTHSAKIQIDKLNSSSPVRMVEDKRTMAARRTTDKLRREYRSRADAEIRESRRAAAMVERAEKQKERKAKRGGKRGGAGIAGGIAAGIGGFVGGAATGIVGAGVAGAVALTTSQAKKNMELDERIGAVQRQGRKPGEAGESTFTMKQKVFDSSVKFGKAPEEVLAGVEKIVARTGDLQFALKSMDKLAEISIATGTDMADLGGVASDLKEKFDVKTPEELFEVLAAMTMQGKKGAFELKDLAQNLPEMAAAAQRFGLMGKEGAQTLTGIAQIARKSTGSSAEAATSTSAMFSDLTSKSAKIKKSFGIDVFDKQNRGKDPMELLPEIIAKAKGSPVALKEIFGEQGIRAISPMQAEYNKAKTAGKTDEEAKAAVKKMIADAVEAEGAVAEIKRDAAEADKDASVKLAKVQAEIQKAFSEIDWAPIIEAIPIAAKAVVEFAKVLRDLSLFYAKITGKEDETRARYALEDEKLAKEKMDKALAKSPEFVKKNAAEKAAVEASLRTEKDPKKIAELEKKKKELDEAGKKHAEEIRSVVQERNSARNAVTTMAEPIKGPPQPPINTGSGSIKGKGERAALDTKESQANLSAFNKAVGKAAVNLAKIKLPEEKTE